MIITTEKLPIKIWTDDIEESALNQLKNLANLPFAFKHIAAMPDCHTGYGMPIGGVLATEQVIIPNAVGVDIGCGMSAVKTNLKELDKDTLKGIMGFIRKEVPVGFAHHTESHDIPPMDYSLPIIVQEYTSATKQIGTLGGGNHFIEIQRDQDGFIWIMVHSGSRNLGKKVCDHYNELAIELNEKYHSVVPSNWQLAFLPVDSYEGQDYIKEMQYCVSFAYANRRAIIEKVIECFGECFKTNMESYINIAHNYAAIENHFGRNVWVHRKGATLAREGITGIIPGSQGSKSYIVEGLGNPMSFMSCSHGAGRKMGRNEARKNLNLDEEKKRLDDLGIVHSVRNTDDLDEASGAYKDIDTVMENQKDLVKITVELTPLGVIKG